MEMEKVKKILMWIQAVLAWIAGILGAKQAKRQWQQALSRVLQKPLFATKTIINIINPLLFYWLWKRHLNLWKRM